jgi:hypothetical protein
VSDGSRVSETSQRPVASGPSPKRRRLCRAVPEPSALAFLAFEFAPQQIAPITHDAEQVADLIVDGFRCYCLFQSNNLVVADNVSDDLDDHLGAEVVAQVPGCICRECGCTVFEFVFLRIANGDCGVV